MDLTYIRFLRAAAVPGCPTGKSVDLGPKSGGGPISTLRHERDGVGEFSPTA
ncbi:hypothetical protein ACIPYS_06455 [Kitasatospora sp. NPDC089913]|uniref:hypothetical protein n=1 Tax=Kitasatospora sp. NPDC089913 TaxID=3364080 RepID=UPI0038120BEF